MTNQENIQNDNQPLNPSENNLNQETFSTLLATESKDYSKKTGKLIEAEIINIDKDYVRLSTGLKSDSFVSLNEFKNPTEPDAELTIKVGDKVECILESLDNGLGETLISYGKAQYIRAWKGLEKAMEEKTIVKGLVLNKIKGGLSVQIGPVKGFLPGSLVDVTTVVDIGYLENSEIECKIVSMDAERNNIVVSRKAIFEDELNSTRKELMGTLVKGATIEGIIKNITDYGAFIDLGGIDGLLHITDIAWERVNHPSEVLSVAQRVQVKILNYDETQNKVSLGMKQLIADPWQEKSKGLENGMVIQGKVSGVMDYGCFVEIKEGVDGLVHSSEFDWINKSVNPRKVVQIGDKVEVCILDLDVTNRRISLSMKRCNVSPWVSFANEHKKGDRVSGVIKSITDFGLFVGLNNGVDALVHIGDLSWDSNREQVLKSYKKGDEIEAVVLQVKPEEERISLGVKQLNEDTLASFITSNSKNSSVEGEIVSITSDGVIVDLANEVKGIIVKKELASDETKLKVGDKISAVVIGMDNEDRIIRLSEKLQLHHDEKNAVRDYAKNQSEETTQSTLGDILKQQIEQDKKAREPKDSSDT